MLSWYAVKTNPHQEAFVCQYLEGKGIRAIFPVMKVQPIDPRSPTERAFFPGYIFIRLAMTPDAQRVIRTAPGSQGLVEFDGVPASVDHDFIQKLRRVIREIEMAGGLPAAEAGSTGGQASAKTLVQRGAIFDPHLRGSDRSTMLLIMLGRRVEAAAARTAGHPTKDGPIAG